MPSKRVIQAGHILALVFIALLLAGARGFLGAHPVLSGALLALVAPVYYVAARVSGHRQFLHPAALLGTLAFQLVIYGAGIPAQYQVLASLIPIGVLFLIAWRGLKRIEDASLSLYGPINLVIAVFSVWVLLRVSAQFERAPLGTALALGAYAVYAWLRFLRTEKAAYITAMVTLGSAAFLLLLYKVPALALGIGAVAGLSVIANLLRRRMLPRLEAAAFTLVAAYLIFTAVTGSSDTQIPLGYLVLAGTWLHLGLVFHRPELPPLVGPHPAPLPRLLPLFAAGILLALAPVALFYPWWPVTLPAPYLAVFFVMFLATSHELGKQSFSLIGVVLARALAVLARLAPIAAVAYLFWIRFFPSYRIALASFAIALLSLLAAWRVAPHILKRRNFYAYQAAVFVTISYFLVVWRLASGGYIGTFLDSGMLLVIVMIIFAGALAKRVAPAFQTSLYEAACLPAAVACVLQVMHGQFGLNPTIVLGALLGAGCAPMFRKQPVPAALFTLPVVLGFWIYVAEWTAGVRGEWLGMPYLVFGVVSAAVGYTLFRRNSRWYQLLYFMWFLCTVVSVTLFSPMRAAGAYAAPLWAIVFLLVSRGVATRRDRPLAFVLESLSALLAAATVAVLAAQGLYFPTGVALVLYAAFHFRVALQRKAPGYFYPAALCLVAGYFLGVLSYGAELRFLAYFLPLAAVLYLIAALLRQRGNLRDGRPLELAASAGAILGALLFLTFPFGSHTVLGFSLGLAYFALYGTLTASTGERVFVSGVGLAAAFAFYEFLPVLPQVTRGNRLACLVPVALLLVLLGRRQHRTQDNRGGWGLYAAAIVVTALASVFSMFPHPANAAAARIVLLVAIAVWSILLIWTKKEIFIYGATLGIAMLAYNFVQSSADIFGQHLVAFFLAGTALLGLVFLAAATRNLVRFRRPTLFVAPAHWHQRVLYLVPVAVLGIATFGSWGVSTSSNPYFCGTCHNMGTYFANWKASAHATNNVSCATCHYEPGLRGYIRAKMKGTSELVATLTRTAAKKPIAEVSNETCLRSGCHSSDQLTRPVMLRSVRFQHAVHLGAMARGPQLRCTSCHTSVDPDTHFAVDTNTCFTCHFHGAGAKAATSAGCVSCHTLSQGNVAFDHVAAGIKPQDAACAACHSQTVSGTAAVEPRQCRHCHIERATQLLAASTADIHARHVGGKGVGCDWCHGAIRHGEFDKKAATD